MDSIPTNPHPIRPARPSRVLIFGFLVLAVCGLLLAGSIVRLGAEGSTTPNLESPQK